MRMRVVVGAVAFVGALAAGVIVLGGRGGPAPADLAGEVDPTPADAHAPALAAAPTSGSRAARAASRGSCTIFGAVVEDGPDARPIAARVRAYRTTPYEAGIADRAFQLARNAEPRDETAGPPDGETTADAQGRYEFRGLGAGEYVVTADVPGDPPRRGKASATIEFEGGRERADLTLAPAGLSFVVEARRADGTPWKVRIGADGVGRTRVGATDEAGRVAFEGFAAGAVSLDVLAAADGLRIQVTTWLPRAEPYVVSEPANLVELTGRVLEAADGAPVAGAHVSSSDWARGVEVAGLAESGADGAFRLRAPPGASEVEAEAAGFVPGTTPLKGRTADLSIRLGRRSRLSGQVVEAGSKAPVAGVHVHVAEASEDRRDRIFRFLSERDPFAAGLGSTVTDASGRFALDLDASGAVALRAAGAGWCGKGLGTNAEAGVTCVEVEPGKETVVALEVERAARVTGVVLDADGKPAAGARVRAQLKSVTPARRLTRGEDASLPTTSGGDGRFVVDSVLPGVEVELRATLTDAWGPAVELEELEPGAERSVELRLARTRTIVVRVLRQGTDAPIARADVSLHGAHGGWRGDEADATGVATFRGVSSESQQVHAEAPGFEGAGSTRSASGRAQVPAAAGDGPYADTTVTVHIGVDDAPAPSGRTVTGVVRFADGRPAAGASVATNELDDFDAPDEEVVARSRPHETEARDDGSFELEVGDGPSVRLTATTSRLGVEFTGTAETAPGAKGVVLTVAEAGLGSAPKVRLRVLDAAGAPVAAATVEVRRVDGDSSTTSNASVSDGELALDAWADPSEVTIEISGASGPDGARLPVGRTKCGPWAIGRVPAEVRLAPEKTIEGVVRTPDGKPVAGATLHAMRVDPAAEADDADPSNARQRRLNRFFGSGGNPVATSRSGADGTFRLRGLDEADFRLEAEAPAGYVDASNDEWRARGGTTGVVVTLRPGVEVVLRVLDAAGKPVAGATAAASPSADTGAGAGAATEDGTDLLRHFRRSGLAAGPVSNARGDLRVPGLDPAGTYDLAVDPPNSRSDVVATELPRWKPASETIRLEAPRTTRGVVRSPTGEGLEGVTVEWRLGTVNDSVRTEAGGAFQIPHTKPGELTLRASMGDDEGAPEAETRAPAGSQDVAIVLSPGAELSIRFEPEIPEASRLEVHVAPDDAAPGSADAGTVLLRGGVHRIRGLRADARYTVWTTTRRWGSKGTDTLAAFASGLRPTTEASAPVTIRRVEGRAITVRLTGPVGLGETTLCARRGPARVYVGVGRGDPTGAGHTTRIEPLAAGRWRVEATAKLHDVEYEGAAEADAGGDVEVPLVPARR